jgi:hypothetical protein
MRVTDINMIDITPTEVAIVRAIEQAHGIGAKHDN